MSEQQARQRYLRELGLTDWQERQPAAGAQPAGNGGTLRLDPETAQKWDWDQERKAVANCVRCELHKTRENTVFGEGSTQADLMVVGEAPGAREDAAGEPFVGQAGQLLTAMFEAVEIPRESVFITNILKCRPPGNADPTEEQAEQCRGHLHRQFDLVEPKVVLALGAVAAHNLLQSDAPIGDMRGKVVPLPGRENISVVATYHPAYLLRRSQAKAQVFDDLLLLKDVLGRT